MDKTTDNTGPEGSEVTSTIIGHDVVIRGDIEGPTDLHVQGRVLGKVSVTGLVLDDHAEIDGPVTADAVVIGGRVNGSVDAKAVHVKATGRIEGDVNYASLQIEAGARVSGHLNITDGVDARVAKIEPASRGGKPRSELEDSRQELVRMATRLRRASE